MQIKPVYLFADSQLLFWRKEQELFLKCLLPHISTSDPTAAYIGASNGDNVVFFHLFESAMEQIGIRNNVLISSKFEDEERMSLDKADVILLAGGDTKKGWDIFTEMGINDVIYERYSQGAVVIGVSAGAVQLGSGALSECTSGEEKLFHTLKIVPFIIDVHDEKSNWSNLKKVMSLDASVSAGFGIRSGAGFIYHPDFSIEVIRYDLLELMRSENGDLISKLLLPSRDVEITTNH